jgi:hypothetical protein
VGAVRVVLLGLRVRGFADLDGRFWSRFGLAEFRGKKISFASELKKNKKNQ